MRLAFHVGFGVLGSIALTASVMAQPSGKIGIYSCIDAAGHRITADRPIPQCADREQRVLSPSGVERGRLGPALTEAEMAQRLEQRRNEQLQLQRQQEQRRRDAVLLARYPDRSLHDAARRDAVLQMEEMQALARKRLQELDKEKQQLDQELQFYQQDPSKTPARLKGVLQDVEKAQQEQRALLAAQADEVQRIHKRFDADLQRLLPLWKSQQPSVSAADSSS
ncbi:DUF4124 domain-containing protein [Comamonas jiangduensis]|uniref:DUF4124 domain-containing protein n=1 Tax=Comamonas jiangduensis TaxID=1194168 RepID=A0ABV4ICK3_9BURK